VINIEDVSSLCEGVIIETKGPTSLRACVGVGRILAIIV